MANLMLYVFYHNKSEEMKKKKNSGLILEAGPGTVHSLLEPQLPAEAVFRPHALKPGPWVSLCPLALCPTPKCQGLSGQAHPGQRVSWGPQQLYMKFIHSTISLDLLSSKS